MAVMHMLGAAGLTTGQYNSGLLTSYNMSEIGLGCMNVGNDNYPMFNLTGETLTIGVSTVSRGFYVTNPQSTARANYGMLYGIDPAVAPLADKRTGTWYLHASIMIDNTLQMNVAEVHYKDGTGADKVYTATATPTGLTSTNVELIIDWTAKTATTYVNAAQISQITFASITNLVQVGVWSSTLAAGRSLYIDNLYFVVDVTGDAHPTGRVGPAVIKSTKYNTAYNEGTGANEPAATITEVSKGNWATLTGGVVLPTRSKGMQFRDVTPVSDEIFAVGINVRGYLQPKTIAKGIIGTVGTDTRQVPVSATKVLPGISIVVERDANGNALKDSGLANLPAITLKALR